MCQRDLGLRLVYEDRLRLLMWIQPTTPIIVRVPEAPTPQISVADVLLHSIGLTGAFVLATLVAGLVIGSVLFWLRKYSFNLSKPSMQRLDL